MYLGRGNNVATPYDDRGEGIMSTQKVGNFSKKKLIWTCPEEFLVPNKNTKHIFVDICGKQKVHVDICGEDFESKK